MLAVETFVPSTNERVQSGFSVRVSFVVDDALSGSTEEVVQFQKQTLTSIFLTVGSSCIHSDAKKLFALTPLQILGGLAPAEPAPVFQRKIQSKPEEDELNLEDAEELVSLTEDRQVMDTASAVCSVSGLLIEVRPLQFFSSTSLWLIASQAVRRREGHWMFHNNNGGSLQPLIRFQGFILVPVG